MSSRQDTLVCNSHTRGSGLSKHSANNSNNNNNNNTKNNNNNNNNNNSNNNNSNNNKELLSPYGVISVVDDAKQNDCMNHKICFGQKGYRDGSRDIF